MEKLGVIGGLGPMATALFMKMVIEMTDAQSDQEHIEMVVYNCPQIPDRTAYILGRSPLNPVPQIIELGRKLVREGVGVIAVPCITANYFYREMAEGIQAPVIDIINETCAYLKKAGVRRAGLMATSGTIASGLFQKALAPVCDLILPDEKGQGDVMHLIYENVKANRPVEMDRFNRVSGRLRDDGAEVILLGCTELSVIMEDHAVGAGYLDVMRLMARCVVMRCGKLRKEYVDIITK